MPAMLFAQRECYSYLYNKAGTAAVVTGTVRVGSRYPLLYSHAGKGDVKKRVQGETTNTKHFEQMSKTSYSYIGARIKERQVHHYAAKLLSVSGVVWAEPHEQATYLAAEFA